MRSPRRVEFGATAVPEVHISVDAWARGFALSCTNRLRSAPMRGAVQVASIPPLSGPRAGVCAHVRILRQLVWPVCVHFELDWRAHADEAQD